MRSYSVYSLILFVGIFLFSCGNENGTKQPSGNLSVRSQSTDNQTNSKHSIPSSLSNASFRNGEILVKFKKKVSRKAANNMHSSLNTKVKERFSIVEGLEAVTLPSSLSVDDALSLYRGNPDVEYAEPNYIRKLLTTTPNDPYFTLQWGFNNDGSFKNGTLDADMDMPEAWDIVTGNKALIVAVIDTGVDYTHTDLGINMWINPGDSTFDSVDNDSNGYVDDVRGWDFIGKSIFSPAQDNDPMDDYSHGTHVAGVIGGTGNNSMGVAGVNWSVSIMPLKVLDANGWGSVAEIISGITYAVNNGAKVINLSLGSQDYSASERSAIHSAANAGVLVIAAAGNGGSDGLGDNNDLLPLYPASYTLGNIISVAASDQNDARAHFSNYGTVSVDVAAPGVDICSTVSKSASSAQLYSCSYTGTSMATPHVAGAAALLWSYYPSFTYIQIRETLEQFADKVSDFSGIIKTSGRINAYESISSLQTPSNLTASTINNGAIDLTWDDNASHESGYKVERRTSSGSYSQIGSTSANVNLFSDTASSASTTYIYRVKAYNSIGDSAYSNEVSASMASTSP